MQLLKAKKYTLVVQEEPNVLSFYKALTKELSNLEEDHLILEFSSEISLKDALLFLDIANTKRNQNTSFIMLGNAVAIDDLPDEIQIAPTLEEAKDILEMDAITRELLGDIEE